MLKSVGIKKVYDWVKQIFFTGRLQCYICVCYHTPISILTEIRVKAKTVTLQSSFPSPPAQISHLLPLTLPCLLHSTHSSFSRLKALQPSHNCLQYVEYFRHHLFLHLL